MTVAVVTSADTALSQIVTLLTPLAKQGIEALPAALQQMAAYQAHIAMLYCIFSGVTLLIGLIMLCVATYGCYRVRQANVDKSWRDKDTAGRYWVAGTIGGIMVVHGLVCGMASYADYLRFTEAPAYAALEYLSHLL